jgi:hypothetical protein
MPNIDEQIDELYRDKIGKKVLLRKKSFPKYIIVGKLKKIVGGKLIIQGNKDTFTVDFEDILSLDVKGEEEFEDRGATNG